MIRFGQRFKCGNFVLMYFTRGLTSAQQKELRQMQKIEEYEMKRLQRKTLPFLKISDISGTWALEFSVVFPIFSAVEALLNARGKLSKENEEILLPYLTMMFADTTILFDDKYAADKMKALEDAMERQKPSEESDEEVLKEMQDQIKGRERLAKMKEFAETHKEVLSDEYRAEV